MNKHPCAAATAVNVSIASDDSEQRRIFHKKHYTTGVLSRGGGTPIYYLYGYVPPNGVVILKLLI